MANVPEVLWAQRSHVTDPSRNLISLAVKVVDPDHLESHLTNTSLTFSALRLKAPDLLGHASTPHTIKYKFHIDFFDNIDSERSHYEVTGSHVLYKLFKKTIGIEYWPRLTKEKVKLHFLKTDFDRWVDEDDQGDLDDEENDTFTERFPLVTPNNGASLDTRNLAVLQEELGSKSPTTAMAEFEAATASDQESSDDE
ncbi:hypothetical protein BABINDRAFT_9004 [Babjeviella inositovora NRRL Y-12698]|uniref:CS domain-containing protein n=1 Tax=Babjeviella inositovora NRRL Y-12698 TaxID=984486 RepID=A0A1E3QP60_9ASCO|nr:uncharacterized protein BABINDRAFT_9004 [Babjeviella inositovora NRRL Y-12698]ODQ78767.1 hypothetical protein BABINDRAFT_9004 [Babjeviella inositovora NRRL Y-12698]